MDWPQKQIRLFRALLYCYPAEFRHEYGAEMEQLFGERVRSEPRWRVWLEAIADIGLTAPREQWHTTLQDLKYGARVMAVAPSFTMIAIVVIALGIGATAAVFSAVNAVLLRSLPYGHPEKLVYLFSPNPRFKGVPEEMGPNLPDFYDWRRLSHSFTSMAMFQDTEVNVVGNGSTHRAGASFVTGDFFRTLQVRAAMGRCLDAGDDRPGHERVAVISDAFWRSELGAAPDVLGRRIQFNKQTYTIVGVMRKEFGYPFDGDIPYETPAFKQTDVWLPAAYKADKKTNRVDFDDANAIARLRDGVSAGVAQAELVALETRLEPLYPEMWRGWTARVKPLVATIVGPVESMLWLLLGAAGLVLLIAIANTGNLLLARASARAHEMGIRSALGAERGRIIRQLLTEALMLSLAGGALGVGLAYAAVSVLRRLNPGGIPRFDSTTVDGRVLFVAVLISLATGVFSGLAPALAASRANLNDLLRKAGNRMAGASSRSRFALIVTEVALSVVLLSASLLLVRSYLRLAAVDTGFAPATLTFRINPPDQPPAFYESLLAKLQTLPGVRYAGASSGLPLSHYESVSTAEIRGYGTASEVVETHSITPEYRKALGMILLRGRDFDARDVAGKPPVVMVNQAFAAAYFSGRDPVGGQLRTGIGNLSKEPWATVVGLVGDVRHSSLEESPRPLVLQPSSNGHDFALSLDIPVSRGIAEARDALRSLDPALALDNVRTMRERMKESNARRTFQTTLLTGFSATAVVLALAGLYGVMSYAVKQRTTEIGVRMALGASRAQVLGMILWQGLRLTIAGLAIGFVGALGANRLIRSWLYGVTETDPLTFGTAAIFMLIVAAVACIVPAWNAMRIEPVEALRAE
jgi:putative ABC transport system permease protein